jgi:hypothetical protein
MPEDPKERQTHRRRISVLFCPAETGRPQKKRFGQIVHTGGRKGIAEYPEDGTPRKRKMDKLHSGDITLKITDNAFGRVA